MKSNPALALDDALTTLCRLWTIKRVDGTVKRFTDLDRDITYEGDLYSSTRTFLASAVQTQINSAAADMDVQILLDPDAVEYSDLTNGMYDDAEVSLEIVDYRALDTGSLGLFAGRVRSSDTPNRLSSTLALVGTMGQTSRPICERYSPNCRAKFGDARCKFPLATVTTSITVTGVQGVQSFTAAAISGAAPNHYARGRVEWLTGDNVGIVSDVVSNNAGNVKLLFKPPHPVKVGDTANIIRGCQKTVAACEGYNNKPNMRAEPYVPGEAGVSDG